MPDHCDAADHPLEARREKAEDGALCLDLAMCSLRSWQWDDATSLVEHANDRAISSHMRDTFPYPYTLDDAHTWIALANSADPVTNFAIVVAGDAVGGIGLRVKGDVHRKSAEIGYWLGRKFWGHGITTEAVRAITDFGFSRLDLCRIYAGVFEGNSASARVLEKAGYTYEARLRKAVFKDGKILDKLLYSIVR